MSDELRIKNGETLISVIIPVYNHAHTLERCLSTLAWQAKGQALEVILVNDGSTDNFYEEMERLLRVYPDIRWLQPKVITQENKGAAAARNHGFKESSGSFIIFLDADTYLYPDMLKKMRQALEAHPEASYAYSQFKFGWKKIKSLEFNAHDLKDNNYIDTSSLIRREAVCRLIPHVNPVTKHIMTVPFDESLKRFQDWDLWLTLLEQRKVGIFIPEVLYKKIVRGRIGMSSWLPSFFYRLPWKTSRLKAYENAKQVVMKKHHLM